MKKARAIDCSKNTFLSYSDNPADRCIVIVDENATGIHFQVHLSVVSKHLYTVITSNH